MGAQTECIPYEEIVSHLTPDDHIAIISCNTCTRVCKTGGEGIIEDLARQLRADGFDVVSESLVTTACHYDYVADLVLPTNLTAAIVMACEVGWVAVVQRVGKHAKVVRACTTSGLLSSVPKRPAKAS
jgi:hypothetical protein